MSELNLVADRRELTGRKVGQLRRQGLVPVVVYGNIKQPVNLQVNAKLLERMLHEGGDTRLVEVTVNGGGKHNVLVKNVQREPIGHHLLHADFYAVNMTEKQHVSVPLVSAGKPAGLLAGQMVLKLHESIRVEALPNDIPGEITVDITQLSLERSITIADLPQVQGVTYVDDVDEVLFNMQTTKEEMAEETEIAEETAEPEVVRKGKQTDEDEEK